VKLMCSNARSNSTNSISKMICQILAITLKGEQIPNLSDRSR